MILTPVGSSDVKAIHLKPLAWAKSDPDALAQCLWKCSAVGEDHTCECKCSESSLMLSWASVSLNQPGSNAVAFSIFFALSNVFVMCLCRPLDRDDLDSRRELAWPPVCWRGVVRRAQKIPAANSRAGPPPNAPLDARCPRHARPVSVRSCVKVPLGREARGGRAFSRGPAPDRVRAVESEAECGSTRASTIPAGVTPGTVAPGQPQAPRSPWARRRAAGQG